MHLFNATLWPRTMCRGVASLCSLSIALDLNVLPSQSASPHYANPGITLVSREGYMVGIIFN